MDGENPYTWIWKVICTECEWRKPIYTEMAVIPTETCMTKIHSKRYGSHSHRNAHDDNPLKWNSSHSHKTVHKYNRFKRDGSHSYRNVHDNNPFKKNMESHLHRCAWRKLLQKEMVVIRTEMCMTTIHSKWDGSQPYRNVNDDNPVKKKWKSFVQKWTWRKHIQIEKGVIRTSM